MAVERRAGAPRLIDWTGERFVPWAEDVQVAYEHYHRYLWASRLVAGRRVLDVGSGEGFGSAILAAEAGSVDGIDIDELTVVHSRLNYQAPTLDFQVASVLDLGAFDDGAFDAVVAFEVLEHLREQERMLAEIDRVLGADGVLIISTPDRRMYSEATGQDNPFHERELTEPELRELLAARFSHVHLWGQRTMCGSRLAALDPQAGERPHTTFLERSGEQWRQGGEPAPMYLVAVASRAPLDLPPAESTLVDYGIELVRQSERETALARADVASAGRDLDDVRAALASIQRSARGEIRALGDAVRRGDERHRSELKVLNAQLAEAVADVADRDAQIAALRALLVRVDESLAWSAVQFLDQRFHRTIGEDSPAARMLGLARRRAGRGRDRRRAARAAPAAPPAPLIRFPLYTDPVASIVIPAHTGADLTQACLQAISAATDEPSYEVIVVDDAADAANAELWSRIEGARIIVNERNLGYLRSVNLGASEARGQYIVPLNNDTEVQPGWLAALVDRAETAADIGIVAPKLLYPGGSVQEAGGVIFRDGTGANFGRGLDPGVPEVNYVRDVDYGSGACLLVRADVWRELGGYDELYLPMYYEDTDLCFSAREHGYRVVYEPAAHVVHVEGGTAGTDVSAGGKRHQELNRPKFVERWREQLATEQLAPSPRNARRGSDRNRGPRVLVVDHRVPFADRDSGSLRMKHMLASLVDAGCRVTFIPDNLAAIQPYTRELQEMGIEVMYGNADVRLEIAEIGEDLRLAIVSRPIHAPRYLDLIREHAPGATIAYDTVDLHFVREERRAALGGAPSGKAATLREIELGLIRGSDVTIVVTEAEREVVASRVPDARVIVVPNANAIAESVAGPQSRAGVLFVGSFEHPPNAGAAIALVRDIMPLVWERLGPVPVTIVGPHPPKAVVDLAGPDVEVAGWVKDLTPHYDEARMLVAPLLYGAGMKGKVTQSLAAGLPVVTTPVGAEGLDAVDGENMLVAEYPADLAERIVRLIGDDELWTRLSAAGQGIAAQLFSPAIMRGRLEELLALPAPPADGYPRLLRIQNEPPPSGVAAG